MCTIADGVIMGYLAICAYSDWKSKEISTVTMILFSVSTLILTIAFGEGKVGVIVGGGIIGLLFFIISMLTKEAIGYGDSWVILLLGLYLGSIKLLWLLFIASFVAGLISLFYLWKRHWKKKSTLPFVPFLFVAYVGVILL